MDKGTRRLNSMATAFNKAYGSGFGTVSQMTVIGLGVAGFGIRCSVKVSVEDSERLAQTGKAERW